MNGDFIPENEAKISIFDQCFLYGDGVFEGIRVYGSVIFKLDEHVERLFNSLKMLYIKSSMTKEDMKNALKKTVEKNNLKDGYLRPIVTRGIGPMGISQIKKVGKPNIIIIPALRKGKYDKIREKGLKAVIVSTRRTPPQCLDPRIKSCNYLNNRLAKIEQFNAGADAGIMLDIYGFVSEGCAENVFSVKNNLIYTPSPQNTLDGVTRRVVIEQAKKEGFNVFETRITPYDLYTSDEVFLTGTMTELAPIVEIDGRKIGSGKPGPVFKILLEKYIILTRQNTLN